MVNGHVVIQLNVHISKVSVNNSSTVPGTLTEPAEAPEEDDDGDTERHVSLAFVCFALAASVGH